jgi:hypothetical protein
VSHGENEVGLQALHKMNKSEVENLGGLSLEYVRQISPCKPIKTRKSDFNLKGTVKGDDSTLSMTMRNQKLNHGLYF